MPKSKNPSGIYALDVDGKPMSLSLTIDRKGKLVKSRIGDAPITGTYDSKTGKIQFAEDILNPTLVAVFPASYTGYVMPSLHTGKSAIAGVFLTSAAITPNVKRKEHGWFGEQSRIRR